MSQFYDQASLVLVPSGYRSGKIYSQKPLSTSGELSFSRASNATRVVLDASGQQRLEKVRTNRVLQSNSFNTTWISTTTTLTSGQADPNGGTSGWRFLTTSAGGYIYQNSVLQSGVEMTASVWVKSNTGSSQTFRFTANSGGQQSGVITATTSWERVSWTFTSSGAGEILFGYNASTTLDLLIYGFQVETGVMTDYIATTSAAVSVGPVSGLPRLDYSGGASCCSLLLEPQRTNYWPYSEQISQWYAPADGVTLTSNTTETLSPEGYYNASKIVVVGGNKRNYQITSSIAGTGTISLFVKAGTGTDISLLTSSGSVYVSFNISTQVVTPTTGTGTITSYGNGWYRITATGTLGAGEVVQVVYGGSAGASFYIWGATVEQGAYSTSYINTLSSAVTRVADAAYKTGISSLIGQTEGTMFWDGTIDNFSNFATLLSLEGVSNSFIYFISYSGGLTFEVRSNNIVSASYASAITTGAHKIALAYNASQVAIYIDGVSVYTDYSVTIPATSNLYLAGWSGYNQSIKTKQALLFKTRLSNADLATLTSL